MRQTRAQLPSVQLDIFHPHQPEPDWRTLPEPVRHQAVKLLAQLFREHQQRLFEVAGQDKEVDDE